MCEALGGEALSKKFCFWWWLSYKADGLLSHNSEIKTGMWNLIFSIFCNFLIGKLFSFFPIKAVV